MQELIVHEKQHGNYVTTAIIGGIAVALIIVIGTLWMGRSAKRDIDEAVHSVSSLRYVCKCRDYGNGSRHA